MYRWLGLSASSHKISPTFQTRKYQSWLSEWLPLCCKNPFPLGVEETRKKMRPGLKLFGGEGRFMHAKSLGCHVLRDVLPPRVWCLSYLRQISIFECRVTSLSALRLSHSFFCLFLENEMTRRKKKKTSLSAYHG